MTTRIERRTVDFDLLTLKAGNHSTFDDGACLLEAASYIAGEPFSDHPECVCPVLGVFGRSWNDALDDESRDRLLKPFIPKLIGTRSTLAVQDARAFMASDWAVRTYTPAWLRLAGLEAEALALESLPVLSSIELCRSAMPVIRAAQTKSADARSAAWSAARSAAWTAAGCAAGSAATTAAGWGAGSAAWSAAETAAGCAARSAAWTAAGIWWGAGSAAETAAGCALKPTTVLLQTSAVDLYERMIAVTAQNSPHDTGRNQ